MIHHRRTVQIAPGRQADAMARLHEWAEIWKEAAGIKVSVSVVTTGALGRMCLSADYKSMGTWEDANTRGFGSPKGQALMAKHNQEVPDGTSAHIPNTFGDDFWRYS